MTGRSFRVCRIAGIPVGISPLWLVIVVLMTWTLGAGYYPAVISGISAPAAYALGLLSVLLLFASILAHEFGHALVARRHGVEVQEIDLWLLGGVSRMRGEPQHPGDELRYALAGPAVTLAIGLVFLAAALLVPASAPRALRVVVAYQALLNGLILVFNMLPAFPLDGGRVARSLLWMRSGDRERATFTAALVGRGFGWALVAVGVIGIFAGAPTAIWLALVGGFLIFAATAEARQVRLRAAFADVLVADLMSAPAVTVPAHLSVAEAAEDYVARYRYTAFPVAAADGRALGLLHSRAIAAVPPAEREHRPIGELADRDPQLLVAPDLRLLELIDRPAFQRNRRAVVVDASGAVAGVISIADVERALRTAQLRHGDGSARGPGAAR